MPEQTCISEGDFLRQFVKHEEALRAFARVLLPTWESVDEVLQEASVVMWKKLPQLDETENFLPWAKVIVRFEALRLRRNHARDRHLFTDDVIELLAKDAAEVHEDVWVHERESLKKCLGQLSSHHRELVLAPYSSTGRLTDLAEKTGHTINSIYKLLGRLREKLAVCVETKLSKEVKS